MSVKKISACGCDTDHHGGVWISAEYKQKRIYFCAETCKTEFLEDPEVFIDSSHFELEFDMLEDV